jgi:class 3 adenylate cyclase/tetratricopeptide (TPR) repeat protein
VRRALGDRGRAHRYIHTLHGHGYRFVAPVEECADRPPRAAGDTRFPASEATSAASRNGPQTAAGPAPPAAGEHAPGSLLEGPADGPPASQEAPPLGREPSPDAGERKLVSVLCCGLSLAAGSGALADLDSLHRQVRELYDLVRREVRRYGGTVQPVVGERVLAVFGLPAAQEDHAQRAVLAALGLQQGLQQGTVTGDRTPTPWPPVRISVHTGPVAVGGVGANEAMALVVGETVTRAVALQVAATPGAILCSEAAAQLVRGMVRLKPTAPPALSSLPTPVYQVLGLRARRAPIGGYGGRILSPFVGRHQELATLHAALARVEVGRGQVVGLVGDPGLGKSRLLYEFRHSLRGRQLTYLASGCLAYTQATPYGPVRELLRRHCGITADDSAAAIRTKVHQALEEVGMPPAQIAPYLLQLLDVPGEQELTATQSPQAIRARTIAALVQLALQGARRRPLVLEVANLQWIDPSSEEILEGLVERLAGAAILLLVTYRPGYRLPWLDKSYVTQAALSPLTPADSRKVTLANLRTVPVVEPLVQAIVAKAGGNPFFLEELTRAVSDRNATQVRPSAVPATVEAVLAARIDRLPPAAKRLLQAAGVIGKEVPLPLLRTVGGLPEEVLEQQLAQLQAGEFLYELFVESTPAYTFTHALTQEVAYGSLLQERRRALHARIVEALETLAGDRVAEPIERMAHHALRGELWDKALAYGRQAGERAMARSACREAVGYFEEALGVLQHLPEQRDNIEQAIDLRLALRSALRPLGDFVRILTALREDETIAAALDDPRRLGQVLRFLANHFHVMGAYDQAIASAQRALVLATASGDVVLHALATYYLGEAYQTQGDYRRAIDCFRETVASIEGARRYERFGQVYLPAVISRVLLVECHAELGVFAEGSTLGAEGLQIAEMVDHPPSLMIAHYGIGLLALRQGNLPRALPRLEQAVGLCQDVNLPVYFPWMAAALGEAYTLDGRVTDAVALLTQAMEQTSAIETVFQALCHLSLGEAQVRAGCLEEAQALAERVLVLAREHKERSHQAYVLRLLGEIAAHREPPERHQAKDYYQQALALGDELGMRPLQGHCHLGLGTLYAKFGRPEEARTELAAAIDLYRAMEMTFWLARAAAALVHLR